MRKASDVICICPCVILQADFVITFIGITKANEVMASCPKTDNYLLEDFQKVGVNLDC